LENRGGKDNKVPKGVWKAVEIKAGEVRIAEVEN